MIVTFIVNGPIVAKQRPRFNGNTNIVFTPSKTIGYEGWIRDCYLFRGPGKALEGEIKATIEAYLEIPKSASKTKRAQMEKGIINPTKKPDSDNIAKSILDALNGIAYKDDSQIVELTVKKLYADKPYVRVTLEGD